MSYEKNLEMIQPLVQHIALFVFDFGPLVAKQRDWTEIWSAWSSDLGVHMYKVSGQ
jgi:hypothetical protein